MKIGIGATVQMGLLVGCAAVVVRLLLFYSVEGTLRHATTGLFGSVAIGLQMGEGLTFHPAETQRILDILDNHSGDYLTLHAQGMRQPLTEFLPGPPVVISALWSLTGVHTFAPYVLLQILLDSIAIGLLYLVLARYSTWLALVTCCLMVVNLATIKRTLMVGYDFWPQFAVLALFLGVLQYLEGRNGVGILWLVGGVSGAVAWFRDIASLLPFVVAAMLVAVQFARRRAPGKEVLGSAGALVAPIVISLILLGVFRYDTTGNFRPTRSTFWHAFACGIGQFSNPYGLINNDQSAWEFGKSVNPSLRQYSLDEMYRLPDSPYETTLRTKALEFIRQYPGLFLRNTVYRVGIMASPLLYRDGDFVPPSIAQKLFPVGLCMLPLWVIGMVQLFKTYRTMFLVTVSIYAYFFAAFGWFYVAGRVILPFLFLSTIVYLLGCKWLWTRLRAARR